MRPDVMYLAVTATLKIAASFLLAMTAVLKLALFVKALGYKNSRHREE